MVIAYGQSSSGVCVDMYGLTYSLYPLPPPPPQTKHQQMVQKTYVCSMAPINPSLLCRTDFQSVGLKEGAKTDKNTRYLDRMPCDNPL